MSFHSNSSEDFGWNFSCMLFVKMKNKRRHSFCSSVPFAKLPINFFFFKFWMVVVVFVFEIRSHAITQSGLKLPSSGWPWTQGSLPASIPPPTLPPYPCLQITDEYHQAQLLSFKTIMCSRGVETWQLPSFGEQGRALTQWILRWLSFLMILLGSKAAKAIQLIWV